MWEENTISNFQVKGYSRGNFVVERGKKKIISYNTELFLLVNHFYLHKKKAKHIWWFKLTFYNKHYVLKKDFTIITVFDQTVTLNQ